MFVRRIAFFLGLTVCTAPRMVAAQDADAGAAEVIGLDAGLMPPAMPPPAPPPEPTPSALPPPAPPAPVLPAPALPDEAAQDITVRGQRRAGPGEVPEYGTGSRLGVPLEELPASMQVVDRSVLRERGVLDLQHALTLVPGVVPMWTYGGFQSVNMRGFAALMLVDGRRDNRSQLSGSAPQTALYDLERIEVLRGPASTLYGYGAVGGVVNQIRRRASSVAQHELELSVGIPHQLAAHVGSQGAIAPKLSYRADLGHVRYQNFRGYQSQRSQGTTTFRYAPSRQHTLQARVSYSFDDYNTDVGIPTVQDPARPNRWVLPRGTRYDARYSTRNDHLRYQKLEGALDYRYQITSDAYVEARAAITRDKYAYLAAEGLSYAPLADGKAQVEREYLAFTHMFRPVVAQVEAHANVDTGPIEHKMLLGYQLDYVAGATDRNGLGGSDAGSVDFTWPNDTAPPVSLQRGSVDHRRHVQHGVYAFDHIKLVDPLILTGGVRLDFLRSRTRREFLNVDTQEAVPDPKTGAFRAPNRTSDFAATGQVGLVYTVAKPLIAYASYASGYRPLFVGASATGVKHYDPERSQQFEGGVRVRAEGRRQLLEVDAAGYLIVRKNLLVPRGLDEMVQAGEARSRGLDLHVDYRIAQVAQLEGGYSFTDAYYSDFVGESAYRVENDSANVDMSGNELAQTPRHTGNAWLRLMLLENLSGGVGVRVVGRMNADDEGRFRMPRYALLDASLRYGTGRMSFALSGNNLVGRTTYFTSVINEGSKFPQVTPGAGREVLGTVRLEL